MDAKDRIKKIKEEFRTFLNKRLDVIWLEMGVRVVELEMEGCRPSDLDDLAQIAIELIQPRVDSLKDDKGL